MSAKRILDIFASLGGLIILAPIILAVVIAVFFALGRPLFFCQARSGRSGVSFDLYKFRTMRIATDDNGEMLPDAVRITPLGGFLRRTSLDELPSILNVLVGDMSLVGPRPLMAIYLPLYDENQLRRFEVKPGITGWAQINGRNALSWEEKLVLDVWYVDNRSMLLDVRILLSTVMKVLKREDISQQGQATMEKFTGGGH